MDKFEDYLAAERTSVERFVGSGCIRRRMRTMCCRRST